MSDLTHEPKHGDWSYECIHCGEQDVPITEECPDHPDRQREDDDDVDESAGVDDGEGNIDVSRMIAERFMDGASFPEVAQLKEYHDLSWTELLEILRYHCEISDGVCEWTWDDKNKVWDSDCGETFQFWEDGPEENNFEGCPFCIRPIEITTDEGGGFDVGHLLKSTNEEGPEYLYVYGIETERDEEAPDYWSYPRYQLFRSDVEGGFTWSAEIIEGNYKRIGSFKPDDDALERVENEPRGELVVSRNTGDVYLYTQGHESHRRLRGLSERGHPVRPHVHQVERSGIVIDFHEIAKE